MSSYVKHCPWPRCGYVTSRRYNLERHKKARHSGENEKQRIDRWRSKRFPCPICDHASTTRPHLKRHFSNKHPDEDLSNYVLTSIPYEDFDTSCELQEEEEENSSVEMLLTEEVEESFGPDVNSKDITVLELITPLGGDSPSYVTMEGEVFRLIPVEEDDGK
ncbi:maker120 [Drosophila busckii]|uniref:Maker120 n=1 Tax=Drosophila busckii TaxID=30019 RepID=A0A0M3QVI6_DROBS|nr:RE1-silencing transcription factor [Drosophila busckii]ALC42453.1 maker120 [Drosophila busckii]